MPPADPGSRSSPAHLGRYRVVGELGRGGMGAVYECADPELDRRVAVKLLAVGGSGTPAALDSARRLRDEARAAARLRHPGLVTLIDTGEDPEAGPFLVYELMRGGSLRRRLAAGPMGWDEALERVARPLLGALDALHRAGVTHRDVKPENLLADERGIFRLGDLGLAVFSGREAKTATGVIYGTPGYLPPECYLDPARVEAAGLDGYSAALTLVEAVAGRLPWREQGQAAVREQLARVVTGAELAALGLPGPVAGRLALALDPDPGARRAEPAGLLADLEPQAPGPGATQLAPLPAPASVGSGGATVPHRPPASPSPARGSLGSRLWWAVLGGLVLGFAWAGLGPREEPAPPADPGAAARPSHERLLELVRELAPGNLPVQDFVEASRAFAREAEGGADPDACYARWLAVLFELDSSQATGPGTAPARALLDAALAEALRPDRPERLPAAMPLLAWSSLADDLDLDRDLERRVEVRRRLRARRGFPQADPWVRLVWISTELLAVERAVRQGDLDELEAAAPAVERILEEPALAAPARADLGHWLARLEERCRRLAASAGQPVPAGLAVHLARWRGGVPGAPGDSAPAARAARAASALKVWVDRHHLEWNDGGLYLKPEGETTDWFVPWARGACWAARAALLVVDPGQDPGILAQLELPFGVVHDWGVRNVALVRSRFGESLAHTLSGELTTRLGAEICESLASARARDAGTVDPQTALAVGLGRIWMGRLDPWDRPNRRELLERLTRHLGPGSIGARILALHWVVQDKREPPEAEEALALWEQAALDPAAADRPRLGRPVSPRWALYCMALQAGYTCLKAAGAAARAGDHLRRLDEAVVGWGVDGMQDTVLGSFAERLLLMRADSALTGGRSAELDGLRPRLEALRNRPEPLISSRALRLLEGRLLASDET